MVIGGSLNNISVIRIGSELVSHFPVFGGTAFGPAEVGGVGEGAVASQVTRSRIGFEEGEVGGGAPSAQSVFFAAVGTHSHHVSGFGSEVVKDVGLLGHRHFNIVVIGAGIKPVGQNPFRGVAGPIQRGSVVGDVGRSQAGRSVAGHLGGEAHLVAPRALVGFVAVGAHLGGVRRYASEASEGVGTFCRIHEDEVVFVTVEANLPLGLSFGARGPGEVDRVAGHIGIGQARGLGARRNVVDAHIVDVQVVVAVSIGHS